MRYFVFYKGSTTHDTEFATLKAATTYMENNAFTGLVVEVNLDAFAEDPPVQIIWYNQGKRQ